MTYPLTFVTKKENSFGIRVVLYLGGELVYEIFVKGSVYTFLRDVVRFLCISFLNFYFIYIGLVTIYLLTYIVLRF